MVVIDVDSHWEPPREMDAGDPDARLRGLIENIGGDVLANVPRDQWPPYETVANPALRAIFGRDARSTPAMPPPLGAYDVPGRLRYCDDIGIDYQFVNGGGFTGLEHAIADVDERRRVIARTNDALLDELDSHADRFSSVVNVDLTDLDQAIIELGRARERGSRAYHVRAVPPGGMSYAHPEFDRLWAATVDLGMVPYLHIGNTPAHFDAGWANMGLGDPESAGAAGLMRLSNSARTQSAETLVAAMAYGGVFARHPKLTLLCAELWAGWFPFLVMRLDQNTAPDRHQQSDIMLGTWPYELGAGEYARRNVRVTPLPSLGSDGIPTLRQLPDMVVFSSDWPHMEGSATPIADYEPGLSDLGADIREAFLGGTMLEVFERMGDPLPVSASTPA